MKASNIILAKKLLNVAKSLVAAPLFDEGDLNRPELGHPTTKNYRTKYKDHPSTKTQEDYERDVLDTDDWTDRIEKQNKGVKGSLNMAMKAVGIATPAGAKAAAFFEEEFLKAFKTFLPSDKFVEGEKFEHTFTKTFSEYIYDKSGGKMPLDGAAKELGKNAADLNKKVGDAFGDVNITYGIQYDKKENDLLVSFQVNVGQHKFAYDIDKIKMQQFDSNALEIIEEKAETGGQSVEFKILLLKMFKLMKERYFPQLVKRFETSIKFRLMRNYIAKLISDNVDGIANDTSSSRSKSAPEVKDLGGDIKIDPDNIKDVDIDDDFFNI